MEELRRMNEGAMLQTIRCTTCGKVLCEATGEVKKKCPACGKYTHVCITSKGIIDLTKHDKMKLEQ
jgi:phage FluMu protein Com